MRFVVLDGQAIAVKLHRQIQSAAKRREKLLQDYNALPQQVNTDLYPSQLNKDQLLSSAIGEPASSGTNIDFPLPLQKRCIELGYLYERAIEEIELVKIAKPKLVDRFSKQRDLLHEKLCLLETDLQSTSDKDMAQNIRGQISLVSDEIDRLNCHLSSIKRKFGMEVEEMDVEPISPTEHSQTETDDIEMHHVKHFIEWYEENLVDDEYNMAYDVNADV